jgi:hypothetical protein
VRYLRVKRLRTREGINFFCWSPKCEFVKVGDFAELVGNPPHGLRIYTYQDAVYVPLDMIYIPSTETRLGTPEDGRFLKADELPQFLSWFFLPASRIASPPVGIGVITYRPPKLTRWATVIRPGDYITKDLGKGSYTIQTEYGPVYLYWAGLLRSKFARTFYGYDDTTGTNSAANPYTSLSFTELARNVAWFTQTA